MKKLFQQIIGITFIVYLISPLEIKAIEHITVTIDTGESITLIDADGDNHYDISTADELYAFAVAVNTGNRSIYGELLLDIVVNQDVLTSNGSLNGTPSRTWTPIGNGTHPFNGCFEGNNHTISGLYCNNPDSTYVGLFGKVGGRASIYHSGIRNVGVIDSYFQGGGYYYHKNGGVLFVEGYTGGIVAYLAGTKNFSGGTSNTTTIQNCYNASTVKGGTYVGGIAGYSKSNISVKNCYNTGFVDGVYMVGGISGIHGYYSTLVDSYNIGIVKGDSCCVGGIVGYDDDRYRTFTRCYYLSECAKDGTNTLQSGRGNSELGKSLVDVDGVLSKKDFSNGEVAYLLQYNQTDTIWGQNIDNGSINQGHPILGGATVYSGFLSCAINAQRIYTNNATIPSEKPTHSEMTAATCTHGSICGRCGETYTEPNIENHTGNTNTKYTIDEDKQTHSLICSECNSAILTKEHSGGTANCTQGATCEYCNYIYTEASHKFGEHGFCTQCNTINPKATELTIIDGKHIDFTLAKDMELTSLTYTRTLPNKKWNALYVPFDIPIDKISDNYDVAYINDVHSYDTNDDGEIDDLSMEVIKIVKGTLHANHPYLIRAKSENAKEMELSLENVTICRTEETILSCSSMYMQFNVTGTYTQIMQENKSDILVITIDGEWSKMNEGTALTPFRVYLTLKELDGSPVWISPVAKAKIRINLNGENDEETSIIDTKENPDTDSIIYNLMGRRIINPVKGHIYIINGKKVLF